MANPVIRIAPNNQVFDLPVIVGIEEGLFAKAGLDVSFSATHADREKDSAERPIMTRLATLFLVIALLAPTARGGEDAASFRHPEDGQIDMSEWLLDRKGFLPVPVIVTVSTSFPYWSLRVLKDNTASIMPTIQKRTTTRDSGQPRSSKSPSWVRICTIRGTSNGPQGLADTYRSSAAAMSR